MAEPGGVRILRLTPTTALHIWWRAAGAEVVVQPYLNGNPAGDPLVLTSAQVGTLGSLIAEARFSPWEG